MKPYYEAAGVTLYHGDCRDVLPSLGRFDALVTDPPYGVNLGKHGAALDGRAAHVLVKGAYASYQDSPDNFDAVVVPAIVLALSLARRGLVFCAGHMLWRLPPATAVGGVFLSAAKGSHAWGFNSLALCALYGRAPELHKGRRPTAIQSMETPSTAADGHPCPKPDGWMRWAVTLASRPGELVVDPFAGSGTTLRAAKDLGRRAVGIEIEERYCEIIARRMSQDVLPLAPGRSPDERNGEGCAMGAGAARCGCERRDGA